MMDYYAHSLNLIKKRQLLPDHLRQVAQLASTFSSPLGAPQFGYTVGLLHDIGKYHAAFQQYLFNAERSPATFRRGPDHKGAGTVFAFHAFSDPEGYLLPLLIAGHHGEIPNLTDLSGTIRRLMVDPAIQYSIQVAQQHLPELQTLPSRLLPAFVQSDLEQELFARMAYSAVVDADFLDTERHFHGGRRLERETTWTLSALWHRFETYYQQQFAHVEKNALNDLRMEVYHHCLQAAHLPPGFFRLTVPTGGGKTLASLAFGLQHALNHPQAEFQRIIYAIPYTSIIEQTIAVFRRFLDGDALLEHHSNVLVEDPEHPTLAEIHRRLAAENWDAPLIVTTTVQLFESLLGNRPASCRKSHHIARSVLILDEIQMLPVHLLTTILNVLRQLVAHYGVTVVLCTATQPDFDTRYQFDGLPNIREIVSEPQRHFTALKHRVTYRLPQPGETWTQEQLAEQVRREHQVLTILNTRRDALDLFDHLLPADDLEERRDLTLFHLSTRQCGAHRHLVLEEIRRRLDPKVDESCRLIATQVIEAGVDVDFPVVLRVLGPLDRIVQAAGRANRHGIRPVPGNVVIFALEDGHCPKGSYTLGTDITRRLIQSRQAELHDPTLYQEYFREYYASSHLDAYGIETLRKQFAYSDVAKRFRIIEDDTFSVIVPYPSREEMEERLRQFSAATLPSRRSLRALQPYTVSLRHDELRKAHKDGLVQEILPGIWKWQGYYDGHLNGKGILFNKGWDVEDYLW